MKILQNNLKKSEQWCIELELKNDDLEQYTRRQNLRISGIPENLRENTDDFVIDFFTKTMNIEVDKNERQEPPYRGARFKTHKRHYCALHLMEIPTENHQNKKAVYEHNKIHKTSYNVFGELTKNRSILEYHARQVKNP